MNKMRKMLIGCIGLALALGSALASAQWELDSERSEINFISIKNGTVAETHRFGSIVGVINAVGMVRVAIDLDSVDTAIDIRDQRMRELLFETAKFPAAELEAVIEPEVLSAVADGGFVSLDVPVTLSLHGLEKTLDVSLVAAGEGQGRIRVLSARPVLLNVADFDLLGGVAALQKIAGLNAIATAIPVTLQLVFVHTP